MKKIIYLQLVLILVSCSHTDKKIDNSIFSDYRYPLDSLVQPKVFVYQSLDSLNKLKFNFKQKIVEDTNTIYITAAINTSSPFRDSTTTYCRGKNYILKDSYSIEKDTKTNLEEAIKGEILDYSDSGLKREKKIKFSYPSPSIITTIKTNSIIDKKIKFKLGSKILDCLLVKEYMSFNGRHKYIPFLGKKVELTGISVVAKGIGLVYYSTDNKLDKTRQAWQLKEIIDYQTYLKHYKNK